MDDDQFVPRLRAGRARPLPEHGTRAMYNRGCSCGPCRAENTKYTANYRPTPRRPASAPVQLELPAELLPRPRR